MGETCPSDAEKAEGGECCLGVGWGGMGWDGAHTFLLCHASPEAGELVFCCQASSLQPHRECSLKRQFMSESRKKLPVQEDNASMKTIR